MESIAPAERSAHRENYVSCATLHGVFPIVRKWVYLYRASRWRENTCTQKKPRLPERRRGFFAENGPLRGARTPNLRVRSPTLYPVELGADCMVLRECVVAVTGVNPVTSDGFGCADPLAGYRHLSTYQRSLRSAFVPLGASSGPSAHRTAMREAACDRALGAAPDRRLRNARRNRDSRGWQGLRRNRNRARRGAPSATCRCGR